jgi:5-methylcytosine-specific restriction endonuclease McrA
MDKAECKCQQCGNTFTLAKSTVLKGRGMYCSHRCSGDAQRVVNAVPCQHCGKVFHVKTAKLKLGRGKYCSRVCAGHSIGKSRIGDKHPRWNGGNVLYGADWDKQRKLAYERDGGICQRCKRKKGKDERHFDVHHVVKRRYFAIDDPAANALSNLITLCPQCHKPAERGEVAVPVRLF